MKQNKNAAMCWCDVCEGYRKAHYCAKARNEYVRYFWIGTTIALFLGAFINAGMTEQFYLNNTL